MQLHYIVLIILCTWYYIAVILKYVLIIYLQSIVSETATQHHLLWKTIFVPRWSFKAGSTVFV